MISKQIQDKGILTKLLEKGINIFIRKECKYIGETKINIIASSAQLIRGIIKNINITAKDINYKDLLFDELELEANEVKMTFNIDNKQIDFNNNLTIQLKISLSDNSITTMLLSDNFSWIKNIISKEFLNQEKLEVIKIRNDLMFKNQKLKLEYKKDYLSVTGNGEALLQNDIDKITLAMFPLLSDKYNK